MALKWKNPLAGRKSSTVSLAMLATVWLAFQLRDPTPPPALDQILIASFGVWFANEAIDRRNSEGKKGSDGPEGEAE